MRISSTSRFYGTDTTVFNGQETMDVWSIPDYLLNVKEANIRYFTVTSNYSSRPDLISYELYGSTNYDWLLLTFNNVTDVLNWPPSGLRIKYPVKTIIRGA